MNRIIYATDGEYSLYPLSDEDKNCYTELHRQINGEGSLFLNPHVKDIMWEDALTGRNKIYSIFDSNSEYCGSIELQQHNDNTPEIGIDLLEAKRNQGIAAKAVKLLVKKVHEEKNVESFLIRISSKNSHSRHVFEKMGAVLIGEENSLWERFVNVLKDEKRNELLEYINERYVNNSDDQKEFVYRYILTFEALNTD